MASDVPGEVGVLRDLLPLVGQPVRVPVLRPGGQAVVEMSGVFRGLSEPFAGDGDTGICVDEQLVWLPLHRVRSSQCYCVRIVGRRLDGVEIELDDGLRVDIAVDPVCALS